MKKQNDLGFTLFELLVVISIIGVLLGMATLAFSVAQKRGREVRMKEDLQAIQKALEQYYALSGGDYPPTPCCSSGDTITHGTTVIMQTVPTSPKPTPYPYSGTGCTASGYCYCVLMEDSTAGNSNAACASWSETTHYCVTNLQ